MKERPLLMKNTQIFFCNIEKNYNFIPRIESDGKNDLNLSFNQRKKKIDDEI